jgi:hypothetical protein
MLSIRSLSHDIRPQVRPLINFMASLSNKALEREITSLLFLAGSMDMDISRGQCRCRR